jgi:hypothetical protein
MEISKWEMHVLYTVTILTKLLNLSFCCKGCSFGREIISAVENECPNKHDKIKNMLPLDALKYDMAVAGNNYDNQ